MDTAVPVLAYSVAGAVVASGLSKSSLERAINTGRIAVKTTSTDDQGNPNGKRLILATELQRFLEDLPDA